MYEASELTATELTNPPNQGLGVWNNGGNGGKWGEMGGNGGKWGEMGNHDQIKTENVGITSRVGEKWGGGVEERGRKRGKLRGKWGRIPTFHKAHFPHLQRYQPQFPL